MTPTAGDGRRWSADGSDEGTRNGTHQSASSGRPRAHPRVEPVGSTDPSPSGQWGQEPLFVNSDEQGRSPDDLLSRADVKRLLSFRLQGTPCFPACRRKGGDRETRFGEDTTDPSLGETEAVRGVRATSRAVVVVPRGTELRWPSSERAHAHNPVAAGDLRGAGGVALGHAETGGCTQAIPREIL